MNYYFEPINNLNWNLFENISDVGFIDTYLATKSMDVGDYLFLYVGCQDSTIVPGVYAVGQIITKPYILKDFRYKDAHCYNRLSVDVKIILLSKTEPYILKNEMKLLVNQFRTVQKF